MCSNLYRSPTLASFFQGRGFTVASDRLSYELIREIIGSFTRDWQSPVFCKVYVCNRHSLSIKTRETREAAVYETFDAFSFFFSVPLIRHASTFYSTHDKEKDHRDIKRRKFASVGTEMRRKNKKQYNKNNIVIFKVANWKYVHVHIAKNNDS